MVIPNWECRINHTGLVQLKEPDKFQFHVKRLYAKYKNGDFYLAIKPPSKERRNNQQNKYYWAVVVEILANEWQDSKQEIHESILHLSLIHI